MRMKKERTPVFNYSSVIKHFAKQTAEKLITISQRLDEQEEEIRKLKHRVRKLEKKNV